MELSFFCFLLLTVQTNLSLLINARHRHKLHFQEAHLLLHKPVLFVTQGKPESICFWAFSAQPCVFVCVFCALFCSITAYPSDTVKACVHFFFTFMVFDIHCCLGLQQQRDHLLVATQSSMMQRRQPSHRHRLCIKIHTFKCIV